MRWKEFLYFGLFTLFGGFQSALASFEDELKKLGNIEVILDAEKLGVSPIFLKGAKFPEFESECQVSSEPQRPVVDRVNISRKQNDIHVRARIKQEWIDYWFELKPRFESIKFAFRGESYYSDNKDHEHFFRMNGVVTLERNHQLAEEWRKSLRKGIWLGKRAKISKLFTDVVRNNEQQTAPNFRVEIKNLQIKYARLLSVENRIALHLRTKYTANFFERDDFVDHDETGDFKEETSNKVKISGKVASNEIFDLASGSPILKSSVVQTELIETGKKYTANGLIKCDIKSKTYSASDLGIYELVKIANVKREKEQARKAKLDKQRRDEKLRLEQKRLAALEAERLAEVERRRKEEVARKAREKKEALERERLAKLELKRKEKEAEEKRIREAAARERQKKEAAEAARLAEIERKYKEAEALKIAAAKLKRVDAIAVIIGNRDYEGSTPDVDFAGNDADAMKSYILNKLGYRPGNILDLRNASQADLRAMFGTERRHRGRLYDYVRADDSDVIVFYSGHGVPDPDGKMGYLLPVDADPNRAELTGYPVDVLLKNLAKVPAKSMMVFIDACFSGDSPKGMLVRATSGLTVKITAPKKASDNMIVITAAEGDQFASWDEDAKHGLFTKHLLEALNGAADKHAKTGNKDGKVTLGEVKAYLDREMTYQARRRFSRDQHATVSGDLKTVLSAY